MMAVENCHEEQLVITGVEETYATKGWSSQRVVWKNLLDLDAYQL